MNGYFVVVEVGLELVYGSLEMMFLQVILFDYFLGTTQLLFVFLLQLQTLFELFVSALQLKQQRIKTIGNSLVVYFSLSL